MFSREISVLQNDKAAASEKAVPNEESIEYHKVKSHKNNTSKMQNYRVCDALQMTYNML